MHIRDRWRVGIGGNHNDSTGQRSSSGSLFAGLRTGPVSWLAEGDLVNVQPGAQAEQRLAAALLEANWLVVRGGNLKLTAEWLDPDRGHSGDAQTRFSAVAEYTPIQYVQLRLGVRFLDSQETQFQATSQAFLELHAYF